MKRVLIPILLVVLLLGGCTSNKAEAEQLQSRIAQLEQEISDLEQQLVEYEAGQDKSEAIAQFASKALELEPAFRGVIAKWFVWYQENFPDHDNYPRYKTRSKEIDTINQVIKLLNEVRSTISTIEWLYAPPEALETKKALLAEGDSLSQALGDITNYYAAPESSPPSLYNDALDFMSHGFSEIDQDVSRQLKDLLLEYEQ